uniref:RanBP2-type domain-containing protein n=1 Tax=Prymnesium polylepis TaxID=72548 RepID=A0A7S4HF99_9EUKA
MQLGAPKAKPKPTVDPRPTRPSAPETPQSPHSPQRPDGEWRCKTCSTREAAETHGDCTCPADFKFCPTCGEAAGAGVPSDKPPNPVSGDWDCPDCNEPCSAMFSYCVECGGVHPPPPPHDCAGCGEVMPHSWKFCPDCGTAATVDKVERGCKPPETTGEEADWTCTKCKDEIPGGFNFCQECGEARH